MRKSIKLLGNAWHDVHAIMNTQEFGLLKVEGTTDEKWFCVPCDEQGNVTGEESVVLYALYDTDDELVVGYEADIEQPNPCGGCGAHCYPGCLDNGCVGCNLI